MSSSTGTFELSNIVSLSSDNNPDQTQEISHVGEQPVVQEMVGSDTGREEVFGTMSIPSGTFTMEELFAFLDFNPDQTQETSHVVEQNVDREMAGLDIGCEEVVGTMSRPSGTDDNPNQTQEISRIGEQSVDQEMLGLDIGKSSHNKRRKRISDVWEKFKRYKDENGNVKAKCNLCEKLFDGSSKKGTTHLRNHFRICQNKRNEGGASGSGDKPAGNSVTDQQLNPLDRVKMLIEQENWVLLKRVGDADIINVYNEEKEKLRIYFENLNCRFSLLIINVLYGKYNFFVVHFIDDDWKLKKKIIGLKCTEGDQNMKVIKNVLSDLGIDKISSMVTDERENRFSGQGSLLSDCKFYFRGFFDIYMSSSCFENEMDPVLYDHMSKIFNYIRETPSTIGIFQMAKDRARSLDITIEEEMFGLDLVTIALGLKEAFFELENMDLHFKSINLTREQWDVLTTLYQFCDENDLEEHNWGFSISMYFPVLCRMYKKSLVFMTCLNSFICGERTLQFVRDAKKFWDQYNLILAVAAVLDPRFKMDIVKHWYKKIYGDECETQLAMFRNYFTSVYSEYAEGTNNFQSSTRMLDISGFPSPDPDSSQSLNSELHRYLEHFKFPSIEEFDILEWWRGNSQYFPTLAKMARDFLAIKVTIYWHYLFQGYLSSTTYCDSDIVREAFVCTESWLKDEESK